MCPWDYNDLISWIMKLKDLPAAFLLCTYKWCSTEMKHSFQVIIYFLINCYFNWLRDENTTTALWLLPCPMTNLSCFSAEFLTFVCLKTTFVIWPMSFQIRLFLVEEPRRKRTWSNILITLKKMKMIKKW